MIQNVTRLLIADAHPLERAGLISIIRDHLGTVEFCESASFTETECALQVDPPMTVVAIDLGLPGLDGLHGLGALVHAHPRTMFLAVGEAPQREALLEALRAGAQGYLPRDMQAHEVAEAFKTVLAGRVYTPPLVAKAIDLPSENAGKECLKNLTARQIEVMRLLIDGNSNKEIGRILDIAESTVKIHVAAAFRVIGVHNRRQVIEALGREFRTHLHSNRRPKAV